MFQQDKKKKKIKDKDLKSIKLQSTVYYLLRNKLVKVPSGEDFLSRRLPKRFLITVEEYGEMANKTVVSFRETNPLALPFYDFLENKESKFLVSPKGLRIKSTSGKHFFAPFVPFSKQEELGKKYFSGDLWYPESHLYRLLRCGYVKKISKISGKDIKIFSIDMPKSKKYIISLSDNIVKKKEEWLWQVSRKLLEYDEAVKKITIYIDKLLNVLDEKKHSDLCKQLKSLKSPGNNRNIFFYDKVLVELYELYETDSSSLGTNSKEFWENSKKFRKKLSKLKAQQLLLHKSVDAGLDNYSSNKLVSVKDNDENPVQVFCELGKDSKIMYVISDIDPCVIGKASIHVTKNRKERLTVRNTSDKKQLKILQKYGGTHIKKDMGWMNAIEGKYISMIIETYKKQHGVSYCIIQHGAGIQRIDAPHIRVDQTFLFFRNNKWFMIIGPDVLFVLAALIRFGGYEFKVPNSWAQQFDNIITKAKDNKLKRFNEIASQLSKYEFYQKPQKITSTTGSNALKTILYKHIYKSTNEPTKKSTEKKKTLKL
jgi:hypothetical protein